MAKYKYLIAAVGVVALFAAVVLVASLRKAPVVREVDLELPAPVNVERPEPAVDVEALETRREETPAPELEAVDFRIRQVKLLGPDSLVLCINERRHGVPQWVYRLTVSTGKADLLASGGAYDFFVCDENVCVQERSSHNVTFHPAGHQQDEARPANVKKQDKTRKTPPQAQFVSMSFKRGPASNAHVLGGIAGADRFVSVTTEKRNWFEMRENRFVRRIGRSLKHRNILNPQVVAGEKYQLFNANGSAGEGWDASSLYTGIVPISPILSDKKSFVLGECVRARCYLNLYTTGPFGKVMSYESPVDFSSGTAITTFARTSDPNRFVWSVWDAAKYESTFYSVAYLPQEKWLQVEKIESPARDTNLFRAEWRGGLVFFQWTDGSITVARSARAPRGQHMQVPGEHRGYAASEDGSTLVTWNGGRFDVWRLAFPEVEHAAAYEARLEATTKDVVFVAVGG